MSPVTFAREWVEPLASTKGVSLAALADVIRAEPTVSGAWLAGSQTTTTEGQECTDLAIAFVVDDPVGTSDSPAGIALIERLDPLASELGLDVRVWAFVEPVDVRRMIASCGREICSTGSARRAD